MSETLKFAVTAAASLLVAGFAFAAGGDDHAHDDTDPTLLIKKLEETHAEHEHGHDFEVLTEVSEEDMRRTMELLLDIGLALPPMDSARGKEAYMSKGCIVCHSVNGIGGEIGPALDAADMPQPMNAFEFAARMWRGAPLMAQMQEDLLGEMITMSGQELADIISFTHDTQVQAEVSDSDIPEEYREFIVE